MNKVCISGYFNPLHVGHLAYIKAAKALGDYLIVIVNNDEQVALKKSTPFMNQADRVEIIKALRDVDEVVLSVDKDRSVAETLRLVRPNMFCNGGDVINYEDVDAKEVEICREINCEILLGVGGTEKIESSSRLKLHISPNQMAFNKLNEMLLEQSKNGDIYWDRGDDEWKIEKIDDDC